MGRRAIAAVVRLDMAPARDVAGAMPPADELPTVAASRTWLVTSPPVARLDVEPATWAGAMSAVDELPVAAHSRRVAASTWSPQPEIEAPAFRKRVSRAYARLRLLLGGLHGG